MTSAASADLAARLQEVRLLSALDPARSSGPANPALTTAVNRAALVLLSAHLEGFLEDLAVEALDTMINNGAKVESLPLMLRAIHTEEHLVQIEPIRDRNARAPRIERLFQMEIPLWTSGLALSSQMVRHKSVCGQLDNPGSTQVRQFLELLGVDIREHLTTIGSEALLGQLDGLVGRRNAIAHGEISVSVTFGDVDNYVAAVEDFSREADAAVARALQGICNLRALPW